MSIIFPEIIQVWTLVLLGYPLIMAHHTDLEQGLGLHKSATSHLWSEPTI